MTTLYTPGSVSPATGKPLAEVAFTPPDQVQTMVEDARIAQESWASTPLETRIRLVTEMAQAVLAKHSEIAQIMAEETGRSALECTMSEIVALPAAVRVHAIVARDYLRPKKMKISQVEYPGKSAYVEQVPRGVVGIIAPWNYPLGNFWKHLFPALLAGNTVVLKPSEYTPRTGIWLAEICAENLPKNVVQCVIGAGAVGAALLDSGIDAVTFTGSVATGRKVAARAGELLIPATVELGGKDAAIVLADCDLERSAVGVAQWSMHNCGHNCAAIERVYVEDSIADTFVERLADIIGSLRVSEGGSEFSDLGPIQNPAQLQIVEDHIKDAIEKGAKLVVGGKKTGKGFGFEPTLLDECDHTMKVATEETFGPVLAVIRVRDSDEAVKLANDSPYGLNGSVWTRDTKRGKQIARQLQVGIALVNNHAITGTMSHLPWTGVKDTGTGVASSQWAYPVFVRPRTLFVDRSSKPDPWWMPADEHLQALADTLILRGQGSAIATLKLAGIVGKRIKSIRELAHKSLSS